MTQKWMIWYIKERSSIIIIFQFKVYYTKNIRKCQNQFFLNVNWIEEQRIKSLKFKVFGKYGS